MALTNAERQEILTKFRAALSDCICKLPYQGDTYLLQWLTARDFDLAKAELMLRTSLQWRGTFGTDLLTDDWQAPEVYSAFYPGGFAGYDKERSPVWILPLGRIDLHGLLRHSKPEDFVRYTVWLNERSLRLIHKESESVNQQVIIVDMEGFSVGKFMSKAGLEVFLMLSKANEANYPELLKKCIVINAPTGSSFVFKMLKPLAPGKTNEKMVFFDTNRTAWTSALLEIIAPDQLPVHWGGTRTDPVDGNPYCSSQICMGGDIPKEYAPPNHAKRIGN